MNKERRGLLKAIIGFPVVVLAGCAERRVTPTSAPVIKETKDVQWRQYQSPIMPYSVDYPQSWSIRRGQFDPQTPFELFRGEVADGVIGEIIVSTDFFAGTLEELKDTFVKSVKKTGIKAETVVHPKDGNPLSINNIDGVDAYTVKVYIPAATFSNQPMDIITYQTIFLKNGRSWAIAASTIATEIEKLEPYHKDFARSFRRRGEIY